MADQSEVAAETPHSRMAREYVPEVPQRLLTAEVKTFFGEYCKIPEEQLAQHIKTVVG